jgi:hypothetical protein
MTTRPDMHVGDYGTDFEMTIMNRATNKPLPLAGSDFMIFLFQPPGVGEDAMVKEAVMSTPPTGADGKVKYTFIEGDINVAGQWQVQALVRGPDGQWHTDIETFEVGENIAAPSS